MSGSSTARRTDGGDPPDDPTFGLRGHRCIVIGAGSGIGRAIAAELVAQQAAVACTDLDGDGAEGTAASLRPLTDQPVLSQAVDVTDATDLDRLFTGIDHQWDGFDVVVNAAGIIGPIGHPSHEIDVADFERVCQVNLTGAFAVTSQAMPLLLPQGYGRVLHIASISGKDGNARMAPYSASKAGLIGLVKAQGKEYATTGVTINAIAPAVIQTPLLDGMPPSEVEGLLARIPMGRFGTLVEVARLAAFVCSPTCSFTTGFTYDLSGGRAVY